MLLRDALGDTLRDARTRQNRTLRDVSTAANVSLGYLSEVERGRKEASSELLASICDALDLDLSDVLDSVSRTIRTHEPLVLPARPLPAEKVAANSDRRAAALAGAKNHVVQGAPAPQPAPQLRIVVPYEHRRSTVR